MATDEKQPLIDEEMSEALLPRVLPAGWLDSPTRPGVFHKSSLLVIMTAEWFGDELWQHVSVSCMRHIPDWNAMTEVKDIFIGPTRKAISVLPCEDEYVNDHQFALHLWARLDAEIPIPDFRRRVGSGKLTL